MAGFTVEYRKIGLLSTCIGNERIRIDSDGQVFSARNLQQCDAGERWSDDWKSAGRLDKDFMTQLHQAIITSGLMALPAEKIDDTVEGGKREELDLTLDGEVHRFVIQNFDQSVFRQVIKLLWGALAHAELAVPTE